MLLLSADEIIYLHKKMLINKISEAVSKASDCDAPVQPLIRVKELLPCLFLLIRR